MCGIFGAFGAHENLSMETSKRATETLYHRGPDCMQYWISEDSHVGLGHARLSINHQKISDLLNHFNELKADDRKLIDPGIIILASTIAMQETFGLHVS